MKYRADIDGLRAIAVLAVVFFHAELPLFQGGFAGVDIFFVISGFLITSIIQKQIEDKSFSYLHFWEKRIRRIFPAAFFCIIITTLVCLYILTPQNLILYGKSLFYNSFFSSNIFFWKETGYFSVAAETFPLLHTWSLSIEEQFYLFLPITLVLINKLAPKHLFKLVTFFVLASFGMSAFLTDKYPAAAFYLLPTRAWELGVGGLLAISSLKISNKEKNGSLNHILSFIGFLLLFVPIFVFDKNTPFPSYYALAPVLGSALLIYSRTGFLNKLLAKGIFVGIGKISYSLYLWHWVFFAFMKHYLIQRPSADHNVTAIIMAFLFAIFSYYFIEQPFRQNTGFWNRRKIFTFFLISTLFGAISGVIFVKGEGLHQRFSRSFYDYKKYMPVFDVNQVCEKKEGNICTSLEPVGNKPTIFLWGDSHARLSLRAYYQVAKRNGLGFQFSVQEACAPLVNAVVVGRPDQCIERNKNVLEYLKRTQPIVFIVGRYDIYYRYREEAEKYSHKELYLESSNFPNREKSKEISLKVMRESFETLKKELKRLIVVHQPPSFKVDPALTANKQQMRNEPVGTKRAKRELLYRTALFRDIISDLNLISVDPFEALCRDGVCHAFDKEFRVLYFDDDHLNPHGSNRLIRPLELVLANLVVL